MIDIIRINLKYKKSLSRLSVEEKAYILDWIFAFANWDDIEIQDTSAGDILELINNENELMFNMATKWKKWWQLWGKYWKLWWRPKKTTLKDVENPPRDIKENPPRFEKKTPKVKESNIKESNIKEYKVKDKVKKDFNVLFNLYKKWDEWKSKRNYLELLKKMSAEEIELKTRIYKFNSKDVEYKYTKNLENILDFDFINSIRIDENILLTIWEEATMMWRVIKNAWDLLFPDIKYDKQLYKEKIEELDKKFNLNILEKLTEWNRNWIEKILVR